MSRVLLINPSSPERLQTPLLGLQYVAASLLAGGSEVGIIDAAAVPKEPVWPRLALITVIATMLGGLLGFLLTFARCAADWKPPPTAPQAS